MPRASTLVAVLVLAALTTLSSAAEPRSVRFEHLSRDKGLSQAYVYTIVQDDEGYMWFGTQEGLNRFDGYEFLVFAHDPQDPGSLSDESIRTMIRDSAGTLWIGTDAGGLSRFNKSDKSFRNYLHDPENPTSLSDNRVRVVYEDRGGNLWVGTDGSGLERLDRDEETFEHFPHNPFDATSLGGNQVWGILEDSSGSLWVGTEAGLSRMDGDSGEFSHFRHNPRDSSSLSDNSTRYLFEDRSGNIWIGTAAGGLNRFDRADETFERFQHEPSDSTSLSANRVNTIFEDEAGTLWIGTVEGLNAWNPELGGFDRYVHDPSNRYSLAHDNVLSIFQDRGGVLWIGTYDGLSKWNQASLAMLHYRAEGRDGSSLSESMVTGFAEDPDGKVWVATFGGGINVLDTASGTFTRVLHDPDDANSLSSNRVMAVHFDSRGQLWAGTRSSGLNRFDPESGAFTRFRHDPDKQDGLGADGVTQVLEDRHGRIWIATFGGGISVFDRETRSFTSFRHNPGDPHSLSSDRVLVLLEDADGMIWAGTYGAGLNCFDERTGQFTRFRADPTRPDSLASDEISMLQQDASGDLWVGVKGIGLNRWRESDRKNGLETFQLFTELDGLPAATIYSGLIDAEGFLWMSTSRGLSRLDTATMQFRNFDTSHGLQGDEFNLSAGLRASDGRLFFGGMNGFNAFDPSIANGGRRAPLVAITRFDVLDPGYVEGDAPTTNARITLKHDQDPISFEFAALDFAAPGKSRYRYLMDGLDREWVNAGKQRQVTYSNLPSGNYTFRVRAQNNDGMWSEQDASLDLRILPAPWQSPWAIAAYVLALGLLVYSAFRLNESRTRHAAQLKYAAELEKIQDRLKDAQRMAALGNWDWDIANDYLWWSDEVYRLFQLDPDSFDVSYEGFLSRVHIDDREVVKKAVGRALKNIEPYAMDLRVVRADGSEIIVHDRAEVTFDELGAPIRMAGTVHDITERKQAEEETRRNAEAQALLADVSTRMLQAQPGDIDEHLDYCLERIGKYYGIDSISVRWYPETRDFMQSYHRWDVATPPRQRKSVIKAPDAPWIAAQLEDGKPIIIDNVDEMPAVASRDQAMLRRRGTRSLMVWPLMVDGVLEGGSTFSMWRSQRHWDKRTIQELRILGEKVAGAIARSRAFAEVENLKNQLEEENLQLREEVRLAHGFDEIVGEDPALQRCLRAVEKVAPTDVAVLLLGETGTGKELFARAIHKISARSDGPMISVNCPALPANLIESELFGHEKGAFTGAETSRRGRFEMAESGTLFLDEIGELPLELQAKLLRVLQTGEFERLGGTKTLHANVRLIAATNRNLQHSIERGEFRSDLYYRISSFPISLPALRDRKGDIPLLAEHFVHKHNERLGKSVEAISAKMIKELVNYAWPGNVRELESIIERALISSNGTTVLDLPGELRKITTPPPPENGVSTENGADLVSVERNYIRNVLEQAKWKISGKDGAAAILGIPSSTLRSKMKKLGIERKKK
ncbi:MAG: sigma 54-interacting transcriptional regulator [Woeseiaceae bacterium]|nr:sigma 54-interacting transcriptional regulator [Woeseiaceae bacterium]